MTLRRLADSGATVLASTHDPRLVAYCDSSLQIRDSTIVEHSQIEVAK
jgi:ABC-type lipoprotein export system ATPase subunit